MRIAIITDSYFPTRDGVVTGVVTSRKALEEMGHTVFVIAPDPGEADREEDVHYLPATKFKRYPGYFVPILPSRKRRLIKEMDVDIIHIHGLAVMAIKGLMMSRKTKIPAVLTYYTNVVDALQFYSPLPLSLDTQIKLIWVYLRNLLKRPKCIIALTPVTISEFNNNKVRTKRTEVIPVGIDINRFVQGLDGSEIRKRHDLEGHRMVIHVGRVSYEKKIEIPIKAVKYFPEDVKLVVVGRGPALQDMKDLVKEEGLEERVVFTGFVSDDELPLYYSAADVIVSASRFETQGLTITEAMACGVPAACSDGRAYIDVIEEGVNGFLFKDTPEECAEAVIKCLDGKDVLSDNARKTAEQYSMESVGIKLVALYESIISENSDRKTGGRTR